MASFDGFGFNSFVRGMDVFLKVSDLNEFFYYVKQILALFRSMSMFLMVAASSLPVSLG